MKLNIVYLITHKERLICNNPPYYYIGSKYQWRGEGTYFGSSTDPILKNAEKSDLDFKILAVLDSNCKLTLAAIERKYQEDHNVVYDVRYFNKAYANSELWKEESRTKAVQKFKHKANSLSPEGIPWKNIWAARANREFSEEELVAREAKRKEAVSKILPNGKTVAQDASDRAHETLRKVGKDGKTGYQRQAEKFKLRLREVGEDGLTLLERLARKRFKAITVGGLCFESVKQAREELGVSERSLKFLLEGIIYQKTYNKLFAKYGEDFVNQFKLLPHSESISCVIEGVEFGTCGNACEELGVGSYSITQYRMKGIISRTLAKALEDYKCAKGV